jgi:hypothetical protein
MHSIAISSQTSRRSLFPFLASLAGLLAFRNVTAGTPAAITPKLAETFAQLSPYDQHSFIVLIWAIAHKGRPDPPAPAGLFTPAQWAASERPSAKGGAQ